MDRVDVSTRLTFALRLTLHLTHRLSNRQSCGVTARTVFSGYKATGKFGSVGVAPDQAELRFL